MYNTYRFVHEMKIRTDYIENNLTLLSTWEVTVFF